MKHIAIAGLLLCLGASAHAANLLINLTSQVPTYTTDGTWIAPSAGTYAVTNFDGAFGANPTANGSNTVDIVDVNTGDVLYSLAIAYNNAEGSQESFYVTPTKENDTARPAAGAIVEDATGSAVDFTTALTGRPGGITVQEIANSPAATPEPASSVLIGLGLAAIFLSRRSYFRKSVP